jgi:hypothetical protein
MVAVVAGCGSDEPAIGAADTSTAPSTTTPLDIAQALGADEAVTLTIDLQGSQVLPAVDTRATARADVVYERATGRLSAALYGRDFQATVAAHIHEGKAGEVGSIVATMQPVESGYTLGDGVVLSARQAALFESGGFYIDVHSQAYPNGFLRAQLTTEATAVVVLPTLEDIQTRVLTPICSGCHNGAGQTLPGIVDFTSADRSYQSLVGVFSINEPSRLRVETGNPHDSLLVHKLEGTQQVGSRMPFRGNQLDQQTIDAVRAWIAAGAAR